MLNKLTVLILCILLSGCSIFKHTSKKEDIDVQKERFNNIVTDVIEDITIEIPRVVFKDLAKLQSNNKESVDSLDTSEKRVDTSGDPVRIKINRKTNRTDNSIIKTDSVVQKESKQEIKKKSTGLFGFSGGVIATLAVILVLIGLYIKFKLF